MTANQQMHMVCINLKSQMKRVRLVKRADGYYCQFPIEAEVRGGKLRLMVQVRNYKVLRFPRRQTVVHHPLWRALPNLHTPLP
jgi:hypothetical protein